MLVAIQLLTVFAHSGIEIYIDMHIVDAEMKSENVEVLTEICSCTWKTLYVMRNNVCIGANAYAYGFACVGTCVCIGICVYLIALLTLSIVCAYVMVDLMSSVPYYNTCLGVSHALGVFWHLERNKKGNKAKRYIHSMIQMIEIRSQEILFTDIISLLLLTYNNLKQDF